MAGSQAVRLRGGGLAVALSVLFLTSADLARAQYPPPSSPSAAIPALSSADLIDTGGEAKILIASGDVTVNGEVDLRRGRQLHPGDVVEVLGRRVRVASS